jgi:hypothetical protein
MRSPLLTRAASRPIWRDNLEEAQGRLAHICRVAANKAIDISST